MTRKEYLKALFWPVIFFIITSYFLYEDPDNAKWRMVWLISIPNTVLYPFSKAIIEKIALRYTTREYWHSGIWYDTPAKNGVYVTYYAFCFAFAIPMSLIYFASIMLNKKAT